MEREPTATQPRATDLSVIIPTRDRWSILGRTLEALGRQTVSGFETIVVVDGTDQRPPALGDVRIVVQDHRGPGAARNTGVRATDRSLVLFLGDDMVPSAEMIERHLAGHRTHGRLCDAVLGHVDWHRDVPRNRVARWLDSSGTQFDYPNIDGEEAGWGRFYSCNASLKRSFFLDAGGFDEDFEFDYEDLDCAYRMDQRGLVLWYEPGAVAYHLHPYDFERLARRYESRARAERMMEAKHPWFSPWFANLILAADAERHVSHLWPLVADRVPKQWARASQVAQRRESTWFHQQLASRFLAVWEGEEDLADLKAYLGDEFDLQTLWSHENAVDEEERRAPDEGTFYRTSDMYLYDLTAFAMTGTKRPYLAALRQCVPAPARVLDYGCGIGSDGLRLTPGGYQMAFADFDNPSTRYLRWRLRRRGIDAPVYDLDREVPGGFDAVYAFDVIEHTDDPLSFLREVERLAEVVAVNLLEPDPADTHLHRPLPIGTILDRATEGGLLHYRKYHRRSHLVIYRSAGFNRLRSRGERLIGATAAHLDGFGPRIRQVLTG
ncbi:MAG TPA: glycosyltransferase [Acidimicrobiales bacterium]|jgi:GT2 family glycosyltransferase/2-polyprenyl-3-methyl-5-hydroxy-6-metoxy-1,4-benzoquinol methylase